MGTLSPQTKSGSLYKTKGGNAYRVGNWQCLPQQGENFEEGAVKNTVPWRNQVVTVPRQGQGCSKEEIVVSLGREEAEE